MGGYPFQEGMPIVKEPRLLTMARSQRVCSRGLLKKFTTRVSGTLRPSGRQKRRKTKGSWAPLQKEPAVYDGEEGKCHMAKASYPKSTLYGNSTPNEQPLGQSIKKKEKRPSATARRHKNLATHDRLKDAQPAKGGSGIRQLTGQNIRQARAGILKLVTGINTSANSSLLQTGFTRKTC